MKEGGAVLLLLFIPYLIFSQEIKQMEFIDQPIRDILFTLAQTTNSSIIPDDTVGGRASYHFGTTDLDTALDHFLSHYELFYWKVDEIYYVSKVMVRYEAESQLLSVYARGVEPQVIFEKISKGIETTILYDSLPRDRLTINAESLPVEKVIKIVMRKFSEYEVESHEEYFYIKHQAAERNPGSRRMGAELTVKDGLFSISAESVRLSEVLTQLFANADREYSLLKRGDAILENIHFKEKSFDGLLRLLLEQCEGDYAVREGIYYIFGVSRNEIIKKLDDIEYVQLHNLPVEMLPTLFPSGLANSSVFQIDKENNAIILSGTYEELTPIKEFIEKIEAKYRVKEVEKIDLSFLTVDELISFLPERLSKLRTIKTGDPRELILEATAEQIEDFKGFTRVIDTRHKTVPIALKYIRAKDLLDNIPPSIQKEDVVASNDPNMVFFKGSQESLERFLSDMEHIDKPIPQIRYELLVVQYQESRNREFGFTLENEITQEGAQTALLGSLGNLLNLNLDVVTAFGYQFAADLNAKLSDSEARVMADTTLNGLTGEDISFQNTNTYRYRDLEVDPDTGETESTGITREITSGLIIDVNGWVSGDEMITMNVESTVSKRGADVSSNTGNPPTTSEKVINTHVRTPSGKPIVIGGLLQQERDVVYQKTPVLSSIPLIGRLFTSEVESFQNTELVIYIVPYIEYPDRKKVTNETLFQAYYRNFFAQRKFLN